MKTVLQHKQKTDSEVRNVAWLGSVWHIDPVNPFFHNLDLASGERINPHPAPFPENLAFRLISLFSEKGDVVLDPFCGSGTTNFTALTLYRDTVGYDTERDYLDKAKKRCGGKGRFYRASAEHMVALSDTSIDLCITSPPYLHLRHYSDDERNIGNHENPYPALKHVFEDVYRVLKKGGRFCLNVADVPLGHTGMKTTFPYDVMYLCRMVGFQLESTIIWDKGTKLSEFCIQNRRIKENHEYVWVLRKPNDHLAFRNRRDAGEKT